MEIVALSYSELRLLGVALLDLKSREHLCPSDPERSACLSQLLTRIVRLHAAHYEQRREPERRAAWKSDYERIVTAGEEQTF